MILYTHSLNRNIKFTRTSNINRAMKKKPASYFIRGSSTKSVKITRDIERMSVIISLKTSM